MNKVHKSNIYFFHGPDTYRAHLKIREWKSAFEKKYGHGSVKELREEEPVFLSELSGAASLFNPATLTVVHSPFSSEQGEKISAEDFFEFTQKNLPDKTHLLFWNKGSLDGRTMLAKKIKQKELPVQVYEFEYLSPPQAVKFIATELKKSGCRIEKNAAEVLCRYADTGNGFPDSAKLAMSARQLAAYCHERKIVRLSDVETLIVPNNAEDIFLPLLKSFTARDNDEFIKNINLFAGNASSEQELLGILGGLFEQVKNMIIVLELHEAKLSIDQIDKALDYKKGRARYVLADAKKFSRAELEKLLDKLTDLEYDVKRGKSLLAPGLVVLVN